MYDGWTSDANVAKYVRWSTHKNAEETFRIVSNWIKYYENNSYNWIVELKESNQVIGSISAISVSRNHHNCEVENLYSLRS
jgi:ribosomal-protein-alanine N-acetyltransferase